MPRQKNQVEENETISESYISIGLGLLVVVVVGILLYNYFTQKNNPSETEEADKIAQEATTSAKPGSVYTVAEGDNLWSIAEKSYKSGYNWTDIAKANNIAEENTIEVGQQLTIPEATPILPLTAVSETVTASPSPVAEAVTATVSPTPTITGNSYVVVAGDNLWDIACKAYGDCYAWTKIAEANKLENPDMIDVGNTLSLPR